MTVCPDYILTVFLFTSGLSSLSYFPMMDETTNVPAAEPTITPETTEETVATPEVAEPTSEEVEA